MKKLFCLVWFSWVNNLPADFVALSNLLTTVDRWNQSAPSSTPHPHRRRFSLGSIVHLAYIYRVHKSNNNLLSSPCGHWAGSQMLDFTSKIEGTRGSLNKNSPSAHDDEKRNNKMCMWMFWAKAGKLKKEWKHLTCRMKQMFTMF